MRFVVFGGRNYADTRTFKRFMDGAVRVGLDFVIEGGAPGADRLARLYAERAGLPVQTFEADWNDIRRPGAVVRYRRDGKPYDAAAGGVRNQRMIDEGKPDRGLCFPGGTGTADMLARCRAAGIKVVEVPHGFQHSL